MDGRTTKKQAGMSRRLEKGKHALADVYENDLLLKMERNSIHNN